MSTPEVHDFSTQSHAIPATNGLHAPAVSCEEMRAFFALLYPDAPPDAYLVLSTFGKAGKSHWFRIEAIDTKILDYVDIAQTADLYFGVGLRKPTCQPDVKKRGEVEDVYILPGVWVDFDHNGGKHSATNLPTPDELLAFIDQLPCRFSLLVDSSGGYHGYLLFKELWILDTPDERRRATHLLWRFQYTLQVLARKRGWKVDTTSDLPRVLRPVGAFNHKRAAQQVRIVREDTLRYNPSDLENAPWLTEETQAYVPAMARSGDFPLVQLAPIVDQCAWLRHCRDDAATLPEPEWYGMVGIVGRCEDGAQLAQEWSAPYPRYSQKETAKKLHHALQDAGPRTCAAIRTNLDGESFCRDCAHWDKVKSPIVLGYENKATGKETQARYITDMTAPSDNDKPPQGYDLNEEAALLDTGEDHLFSEKSTAKQGEEPRDSAAFNWKELCNQNKDGSLKDDFHNYLVLLGEPEPREILDLQPLWFDVVRNVGMMGEEPCTEQTLLALHARLCWRFSLSGNNPKAFERAMARVCQEKPRDLIVEYLNGLPPHSPTDPQYINLRLWMHTYLGVEDTAYTRAVSRILLCGMVQRALKPGCQFRYIVALEGKENTGKSKTVKILAGDWYREIESFEGKEAHMLLQGAWLAEIPELVAMKDGDERRFKQFITNQVSEYLPKFSNNLTSTPRRTVFMATTNESDYLRSISGNTRVLPVKTGVKGDINIAELTVARDGLMASALAYVRQYPQTWWQLEAEAEALAKDERDARRKYSVWDERLSTYLATVEGKIAASTGFTYLDIGHALECDTKELSDMRTVSGLTSAIKKLGYERKRIRDEAGTPVWKWEK